MPLTHISRFLWHSIVTTLQDSIQKEYNKAVTKNLINLDNNKITKIARISEGLERKKNPRSVIFITSKY